MYTVMKAITAGILATSCLGAITLPAMPAMPNDTRPPDNSHGPPWVLEAYKDWTNATCYWYVVLNHFTRPAPKLLI